MVASRLGLVALLAACADLHAPPATGAAGADGASGSNGIAGASSQAGSGGTTPSGASGQAGAAGETACAHRDSGDIQAWLYQEIATDQSNELHPFVTLTNSGLSVPLKELAIRYYFSGERSGDWQLTCIWVTKESGTGSGLCDEGVSLQIVALDPPRPQADQYLEISFAGVSSNTLSEGFPVEARSMFWRVGRPMLNQANDYSFVPTRDSVLNVGGIDYKQTLKVTVYRNGVLVWGEEPCP